MHGRTTHGKKGGYFSFERLDVYRVAKEFRAWVVHDLLPRVPTGEGESRDQLRRASKSISEERTYGSDMTDADEIDRALFARAEGIARQLRREGLEGRTVHLKVRVADFTTWTRSRTLTRSSPSAAGSPESWAGPRRSEPSPG